jgi:hypothetical protein
MRIEDNSTGSGGWWSPPWWNPAANDDDKPWWFHMPTNEPTAIVSTMSDHHKDYKPTRQPTRKPSFKPSTFYPSRYPTRYPTYIASVKPTDGPSNLPVDQPTYYPTAIRSWQPSNSEEPTYSPTSQSTDNPTARPTIQPSTGNPTAEPTNEPSTAFYPTILPSIVVPSPTTEPTTDELFDFPSAPMFVDMPTNQSMIDITLPSLAPTHHRDHASIFIWSQSSSSLSSSAFLSYIAFLMISIISILLCCFLCYSCILFRRKKLGREYGYIAIPTATATASSVPIIASPAMDHVIEMTDQILNDRPAPAKIRREEKKQQWIQDIYNERFQPKRPRDVERYKYEKKRRELASRLCQLAAQGDIELTKKQLAAANCILHFYDQLNNQDETYPDWTEEPFTEACNVLKVYDIFFQVDENTSGNRGQGKQSLYGKWQYQNAYSIK